MTEPLTGLNEAIEAGAIANYGSNGNWTLRSEEGREAARDLVRFTVEAAYPVVAAAVRAEERAKGEATNDAAYASGREAGRVQAMAERDRLRDLVDRQLGECIGCTTEPDETCPRDGRSYSDWVEAASLNIGRNVKLRETLAKARALHRTVVHPVEGIDMCVVCAVEAPCPTVEALAEPTS